MTVFAVIVRMLHMLRIQDEDQVLGGCILCCWFVCSNSVPIFLKSTDSSANFKMLSYVILFKDSF